jgi:lysozyme family protein
MIGTTVDGGIGPNTLAKVEEYIRETGEHESVKNYQEMRQKYYERLPTFATFGKGWTRRVEETTKLALDII